MKDYLFRKNLNVKKFPADLEISTSYLYQLLRGERKPSLKLAHKIEKYTNGEVAVKKLLGETLHKKGISYKELENYQMRLLDLEAYDESIKIRFDSIERRLSRLEKERDEKVKFSNTLEFSWHIKYQCFGTCAIRLVLLSLHACE